MMSAVEANPRTRPILEATVRVIGRDGVGAVTHRAVAHEADVSTGAIAHHFASRDALVEATLLFMGRREIDALERLALELQASAFDTAQWVDGLAATLAARVEHDRAGQIAVYELLIESARSERIRTVMEEWNAAFLRLAELGFRARQSSDPELHGRIGGHDDALMDEIYAEDVVLYSPLAWPVRGRKALKAYVDEFHRGYPGLRVVLHDEFYSADGTRGCFRFVTHWRNGGSFFGHAATGQQGTQTETHSIRIRDGRIVEQWVGDNSFQMPYMDLVTWGMDFPRETPDPAPEIASAPA